MVPGACFGNGLARMRVRSVRKERAVLNPHFFATYGLVAMLALVLLAPSLAPAQGSKKGKAPEVKTDAQPRGATESDENIKNPSEQNDPGSAAKAPPDKGGEKTRQA